MQQTWVHSLGQEYPLEEGMATHSSILAWRIPMDREAWWATVHGGHKELDMTERLSTAQRRGFLAQRNCLYTIVAEKHSYPFVKTYRGCETKTEPSCKL